MAPTGVRPLNITEITPPVSGTASVLNNAQNARIKNSTFIINATTVNTSSKPTLEVLYQRVAPNAISNEGGRADIAKCLPGTREELIAHIEKWRDDVEGDRILWLSGPAGGGKTAIMKTIAERSLDRDVHTINFFFFREDSTRNGPQPMIPTLLYQLFQLYPEASDVIATIVSTHPRVFDGSIAEQCKLISALAPIIRQSSPTSTPIVLLVDGLDECDVDVDVERSQGLILHALDSLVAEKDSPFRLLVASRPEAHIKQAFNQLSSKAQTMFLDEQYSPEKDIRIFVTVAFEEIKASHPSAHLVSNDWPLLPDIEEIVRKSSGQFIYAATVMRYIAHASVVPSLSLDRMKGIVPTAKNSPFAILDSIYLFILSRADDPEAIRDILSMKLIQRTNYPRPSLQELLYHYNFRYTRDLLASCTLELSALVRLTSDGKLEFYHASFIEFLRNKTRSGGFWIDENAFRAKFLLLLWEEPGIEQEYYTHPHADPSIQILSENLQTVLLKDLDHPTPDITFRLLNLPLPNWILQKKTEILGMRLVGREFGRAIEELYFSNDREVYKQILCRFIRMAVSLDLDPDATEMLYAEEYIIFYRRWNWWFQLMGTLCG